MQFVACGQSAASTDAFEIASIKAAQPQGIGGRYYSGCAGGPGTTDPGRITCTSMALIRLIVMAYGIEVPRISGLKQPADLYDIIAKVPAGATRDQVSQMWRHLLAERFHLAAHRETKELPVFLLIVANGGAKLKQSTDKPVDGPEGETGAIRRPSPHDKDGFPLVRPNSEATSFGNGAAHYAASKIPLEYFAAMLQQRLAADLHEDRIVIDATGLKGNYDIKLTWTPGEAAAATDVTLLDAIESQLGLKLERKRREVEILVIDRAETPVEN